MNTLLLGSGDMSAEIRARRERPYLLIADAPIPGVRGQKFDPEKHSIDLLKGVKSADTQKNYRRACDFVALINETFPEGESTLMRKNATFELFQALRNNPTNFLTLLPESEDPAVKDARQKVERLFFSPVLKKFLTGSVTVDLHGNVVAVLDRKKYGPFDTFFIAHTLISMYEHQVIIDDFAFYGRDYLEYLAIEERLICGVRSLELLSKKLRDTVLLFGDKVGRGCTAEDADVLASYAGHIRDTNAYNSFVAARVA